MSWRNGRELATASNGTHTVSCDYDVNILRTYKIVDGVRHDYVYASGQLLRETYTESGTTYTLDFLYDQSGRPYMLYLTTRVGSAPATSAPYYYLLNLQGDVLYLVNASGEPVAHYEYDPYGAILSASGSLANVNPLRYRGYYYDVETGFYYLQSRYYAPTLGRFLNADSYASTGQGFIGYNMFAYCNNDPIIYFDKTGNSLFPTTFLIDECGHGQSTCTIDNLRDLNDRVSQWNSNQESEKTKAPYLDNDDVVSCVLTKFVAGKDPRSGSFGKWALNTVLSLASSYSSPFFSIPLTAATITQGLFMLIDDTPLLQEGYTYCCYYIDKRTNVSYYYVNGEEYVSECHTAYYVIWAEDIHGEPGVFKGFDSISYWKEYPRR